MGPEPDRQEEGQDAPPHPIEVQGRCSGGADHHVAKVPDGVWEMEQSHVVSPASPWQRVKGRHQLSFHR